MPDSPRGARAPRLYQTFFLALTALVALSQAAHAPAVSDARVRELQDLGAVKYGNIFSLDVGPDYAGRLRAIDVQTLRRVGEMIKSKAPAPGPTAPP